MLRLRDLVGGHVESLVQRTVETLGPCGREATLRASCSARLRLVWLRNCCRYVEPSSPSSPLLLLCEGCCGGCGCVGCCGGCGVRAAAAATLLLLCCCTTYHASTHSNELQGFVTHLKASLRAGGASAAIRCTPRPALLRSADALLLLGRCTCCAALLLLPAAAAIPSATSALRPLAHMFMQNVPKSTNS